MFAQVTDLPSACGRTLADVNPPVRVDLHVGHALHVLNQLPDATAAGCVTSSPYFKRRAYGTDPAETGAGTLAAFLDDIEHVARALHRVCRPDALCFWNIGDTAAGSGGAGGDYRNGRFTERPRFRQGDDVTVPAGSWIGVPGLVRARLVAAGWLVRADIVWQKTTPRPEDVAYVRRPLEQSEVVFMLAKGRGYAYVPEAATYGAFETARHRLARELRRARLPHTGRDVDQLLDALAHAEARMERGNVWRIPTDRAKGGHRRRCRCFSPNDASA